MAYVAGSWMDGGLIPDVTKNSALTTFNQSAKVNVSKVVNSIISLVTGLHQEIIQGTQFVEKGPLIRAGGTSSGSNGASTLNDTTKTWGVNAWANKYVRIYSGLGAGLSRKIVSNTATALTILGTWGPVVPNATSVYEIYDEVGNVVSSTDQQFKEQLDGMYAKL